MIDTEDAAAYTFIMIIVAIFVFALSYAFLIPALNKITSIGLNPMIDNGQISEQTKVSYEWNLTFFQYSIGIGLIGLTIFGIVRAIEISTAGD